MSNRARAKAYLRKIEAAARRILGEADMKTSLDSPPPCFDSRAQYADWLEAAASKPPPTRRLDPSEPNYCKDCTVKYRNDMIAEGRCLFPTTQFSLIRNADGDLEVVGHEPGADPEEEK